MNLLQVRQQFRAISGRYDLVNSDGSDNGADFYINEGSRYLDRLERVDKSPAYYYTSLAIGFYSVNFPLCRAVQEVWVTKSTGVRWQLEKKTFQWLRAEYAEVFGIADTGAPAYYAPINLRTVPDPSEVQGNLANYMAAALDVINTNTQDYNAVIIIPPTDEVLTVEVGGLFYQRVLDEDSDENYWTQLHPFLLIQSAMMQVEIANRNTQGVNDWKRTIGDNLSGIGMDVVEEDISEYNQMEG